MEKSVRKSQPNAQKPAAAVEMKSKELIPEWWWAALLAIVCYIVTFGHGFVLDDSTIFKNNYLFQPGATKVVSTLFKTGYWYGYTHSNVGVYRPLPLVVLYFEQQIFGTGAASHHVINVLIFAGICSLVFRLVRRLLPEQSAWVAFATAALFAVLPIHTEVVANIKSHDELMATLFGLLAWLQLVPNESKRKPQHWILAGLFFFCSTLSKESTLPLVVLVPLSLWFFNNESPKGAITASLALLIPVVIYVLIRASVLETSGLEGNHEIINNSLVGLHGAERIATLVFVLGQYLILQFVPFRLSYDYSYNQIPGMAFGQVEVWFAAIAYLGLVGLAIAGLRKKTSISFGIWFYLLSISLVSNIAFLVGTPMAERLTFLPSLGLCFSLVALVSKGLLQIPKASQRIIGLASIAAFILIYTPITVARSLDWADNDTLFTTDAPKVLNSARAQNDWGSVLAVRGDSSKGIVAERNYRMGMMHINQALHKYPRYDACYQNLAYIYGKLNKPDSVGLMFAMMRKTAPNHPAMEVIVPQLQAQAQAYIEQAIPEMQKGNYATGVWKLRRAWQLDTANPMPAFNIGNWHLATQHLDSGIYYLHQASRLAPQDSMIAKALAKAKAYK